MSWNNNFLTATSVASLQTKSLQMRQTLSKSYRITCSPSSTSHVLLIHQCDLQKGDADPQFKKYSDTAENSDIIHDIRGMDQEIK